MEHTPCACAVIGHRTVNIEYCPLHAAALELLGALETIVGWLDERPGGIHPETVRGMAKARAAIEKARDA